MKNNLERLFLTWMKKKANLFGDIIVVILKDY